MRRYTSFGAANRTTTSKDELFHQNPNTDDLPATGQNLESKGAKYPLPFKNVFRMYFYDYLSKIFSFSFQEFLQLKKNPPLQMNNPRIYSRN
uniref:Putative ovule protein n=1 Tax=Solanum chacoense TaxID=4108 RepID=A0A0V0I8L5_SOLCH